MKACRTCEHFLLGTVSTSREDPRERHRYDFGICRRFPPRVFIDEEIASDSRWPEVHPGHRCGEWAPNETVLPI